MERAPGPGGPTPSASEEVTTFRTSVVVLAAIDHAFSVFTADMGSWWPRTHHIGKPPMATAVVEPRAGGRWYELGDDGSACEWGMVVAWEPPAHVAFSWHLDADFAWDPAASRASRVDVFFRSQADGSTRVELVHSGLDQHGEGWKRLRDSASGGWKLILGSFAARVEAMR